MMDREPISAEIEFAVEFYDVDPMQVVWHGNYVKYFEKARCALLDSIGYGYLQMIETGYVYPVTNISLKYIGPFKFGEMVRAKAILEEYENCLKIKYELRNAKTGEIRTKGGSTQMAMKMDTGESCFACPQVFIDRVEAIFKLRDGAQ
ncbi:MAG: acyl-CoA thioesterase [Treponema sp.]|nr:acyl-CoA thioesterase [Treponema sp.]